MEKLVHLGNDKTMEVAVYSALDLSVVNSSVVEDMIKAVEKDRGVSISVEHTDTFKDYFPTSVLFKIGEEDIDVTDLFPNIHWIFVDPTDEDDYIIQWINK